MSARRRITYLFYLVAGLGASVFILSFPLHSRLAFLVGGCLIACGSLIQVGSYLADRDPKTRLQNIAGASLSALFAVWCLAWLAVPAIRVHWITLIVGLAFVAGFCAFIYLNWQSQLREKRHAAHARRR
jgi:hypothetical protein